MSFACIFHTLRSYRCMMKAPELLGRRRRTHSFSLFRFIRLLFSSHASFFEMGRASPPLKPPFIHIYTDVALYRKCSLSLSLILNKYICTSFQIVIISNPPSSPLLFCWLFVDYSFYFCSLSLSHRSTYAGRKKKYVAIRRWINTQAHAKKQTQYIRGRDGSRRTKTLSPPL